MEYTDTGLTKIKNFYFLKDMVKKWNGKLGENIYSMCNQQKVCIQKMYKGPKFKNKKVAMQLKMIKINNIWKLKKNKDDQNEQKSHKSMYINYQWAHRMMLNLNHQENVKKIQNKISPHTHQSS